MAAPTGEPKPWARGFALSAGAGLLGPAGAWAVKPVFGMVLAAVEVSMALAIVLTAVYGSDRHSNRAFRFLRLTLDRAEPPARRPADGAGLR
jgi:hypothetical protein